jgi:hypothetical protein
MLRYSNWKPVAAPIITIIGWLFSFWMIFMVPMDLHSTIVNAENPSRRMVNVWLGSSYANLILNYLLFPYAMAYIGSASFTRCDRFKDALKRNCAFYILYLIVGLIALMLLLFSRSVQKAVER